MTTPSTTSQARVTDQVDQVTETVIVTPRRSGQRAYLMRPVAEWEGRDLRDYLVDRLSQLPGFESRLRQQPAAEISTMKAFMTRWGGPAAALMIVNFALDYDRGYWRGSPITTGRFCQDADSYVAEPIAQRVMKLPPGDRVALAAPVSTIS